MSNVKTVNLTGVETEVNFEQKFMCFWIQNLGSDDVYASADADVQPESDGVVFIGAGNSARVSKADLSQINTLYLTGSGKVQIVGCYSVHCPFKIQAKGGGGAGGSGIKLLTYGDAGLFDKKSVNIIENTWTNLLNSEKRMIIGSNVRIENDEVIFSPTDTGQYSTIKPRVIYLVTKTIPFSSGDSSFVMMNLNSGFGYGERFDLFSISGQKYLFMVNGQATTGNYVQYETNTSNYHIICIASGIDYYPELYIDGNLIGKMTQKISDNYYAGSIVANGIGTGASYPAIKQVETHYKAIVIDTENHSVDDIKHNMEYLRVNYLKEE